MYSLEYGRSTVICVSEPTAVIRRRIGETGVVLVTEKFEPVPVVVKSSAPVLPVASLAELCNVISVLLCERTK